MKPDFRIEIDGVDKTAAIRVRLLDAKVTDEAGQKSDRLDLTFDDRDGAIPLPPKDARIRLWLGYAGHPAWLPAFMGTFQVDEVEVGSGPRSLSIRAKAAELNGVFRAPKMRSFDGKTLGDIVGQIAADNNLTPLIDPELASVTVGHIDQTEESDTAFLTRLAERFDATAKPADGKLIFAKRHGAKLASGKDTPTIALTPADFTSWKATLTQRGAYDKVTSYYQDHDSGERVGVTVSREDIEEGDGDRSSGDDDGDSGDGESKGGGTYKDRATYGTPEEAEAAATAKLKAFKRGQMKFSGSGPGRPDLFAEARVSLSGFRDGVDGTYAITSANHSFSNSGYTTGIDTEAA